METVKNPNTISLNLLKHYHKLSNINMFHGIRGVKFSDSQNQNIGYAGPSGPRSENNDVLHRSVRCDRSEWITN